MRLYYDRLVDLLVPYGAEVFNKAAIEQLVGLVEDCYRDNPMQYEKICSGFSTIVRSNLSKGVIIKITIVQGEHGMVSLSVGNFAGQHLVTIVEHATDPLARLDHELSQRRPRNYQTRTGALVPVPVPRGRLQLVACYPEQLQAIASLVTKQDHQANDKKPSVIFTMTQGLKHPAEFIRMVREYADFRTIDLIVVYPLKAGLDRSQPITYWADKEAFLNCPKFDLEASHVVFAELIDNGAACRATVMRCRSDDKTSNGSTVAIPTTPRKSVYEMLAELFPAGERTINTEELLTEFMDAITKVAETGQDFTLEQWVANTRQHWDSVEGLRYTHHAQQKLLILTAQGGHDAPLQVYYCRNQPV